VYRNFGLTGSLSRFSVELARYLSTRHDVHVYSIARRTDKTLAAGVTFHDVPVISLGSGSGFCARELLSFARNTAALLDRERFDIVHVRAPGTWRGDVLHVPGVVRGEARLQGYGRWRLAASTVRHPGNAARRFVERRALDNPGLRRIHVDAPTVRDDLVRIHGFDGDDVLVAVPGVNLDEFHPALGRAAARIEAGLGAGGDRLTLLFCGHDFERKGLARAIEAVAAARVEADLIVIGASPETPKYRALAERHGVGERIRFLGERADAAVFFRAADAFLLPTHADIWGVTVVEAMAAGTPPVVSAAAGAASAVDDGRTGIVLPEPYDPRDLRDAIERLANDVPYRLSLGSAGRQRAARYSWEAHCTLVESDLVALNAEAAAQIRRRRGFARPHRLPVA
jgi:glycosyltransferase involved in cell wall biosynthesis